MAGNLDYSWRLFQRSWSLTIPTFGLGRFFRFLSGYDLTVGVWIRTRTDRVKEVAERSRLDWKAVSLPLNEAEDHRD
jgi:hypothetical protein